MSRQIQKSHHEKIRKKIIATAQAVAADEGWESVTMRRLAKEIKYTLPVLYHYFKSKEDIITQVANAGFLLLLKALEKVSTTESIRENVKAYFFAYIDFAQQNAGLYQAMYGLNGVSSFTEGNPGEGERIFFTIQKKLEIMKENGAQFESSWTATKVLWSMLHGLVTLHGVQRIEGPDTQLSDVVEYFTDMVVTTWKMEKMNNT